MIDLYFIILQIRHDFLNEIYFFFIYSTICVIAHTLKIFVMRNITTFK